MVTKSQVNELVDRAVFFQSEIRNPESQIEGLDTGKEWYKVEGIGCQEFGSWNAECGKLEKAQGLRRAWLNLHSAYLRRHSPVCLRRRRVRNPKSNISPFRIPPSEFCILSPETSYNLQQTTHDQHLYRVFSIKVNERNRHDLAQ
jgi:hypothetical protein